MLTVKSFIFNPVQENTYVLYNGKNECCIIDPGCYFQKERDELKTYIGETGLTPVLLLNTHCHLDHVFGNKFVYDTWHLPLHLHALEKPLLERAPESGVAWGMPFENYAGELEFLEPGKPVMVGEEKLETLFTPGHSPGSVSFYHEAGKFLIGGDVLFFGSIGRTDLPGGDLETLLGSIREQFFPLPNDTKVYSGHGQETTVGYERKNNPF
jgi:glyoxylase-like metal-dependent hydrolase (beta-lactamase superfamily II)